MIRAKIPFLLISIIICAVSYSQDSIRFITQKIQLKKKLIQS